MAANAQHQYNTENITLVFYTKWQLTSSAVNQVNECIKYLAVKKTPKNSLRYITTSTMIQKVDKHE